jgi:protein-L-isoaspartate(D-aspartate) O-methyltransferase
MDKVMEWLAEFHKDNSDHPAGTEMERALQFLQVERGNRVLEIGGTGITSMLLSVMAEREGRVVSLHAEPPLIRKATGKRESEGTAHIRFEPADGRSGFPEEAPYDRIISWTGFDSVPEAWREQLAEGGVLVAPLSVLPLPDCQVICRFVKKNQRLTGGDVWKGSRLAGQSSGRDCAAKWEAGEGEEQAWAGAAWMKGRKPENWGHRFRTAQGVASPVKETAEAIRPFLLATAPEGFTTAHHPVIGRCIGYSTADGFALAAMHERVWLVTDDWHGRVLRQWWDEWGRRGKPEYKDLRASVYGGKVRLALTR